MGSEENKLLIIGNNLYNQKLLGDFIEKIGYDVIRADSLDILSDILLRPQGIRLALLHITGFEYKVWDYCVRLNELDIPLLLITKGITDSLKRLCMRHHINTILEKPIAMTELVETINIFMKPEKA